MSEAMDECHHNMVNAMRKTRNVRGCTVGDRCGFDCLIEVVEPGVVIPVPAEVYLRCFLQEVTCGERLELRVKVLNHVGPVFLRRGIAVTTEPIRHTVVLPHARLYDEYGASKSAHQTALTSPFSYAASAPPGIAQLLKRSKYISNMLAMYEGVLAVSRRRAVRKERAQSC
jgi:hypothetical protein